MTQAELGSALGIKQAAVSKLIKRGMPDDDIEAAKAWRANLASDGSSSECEYLYLLKSGNLLKIGITKNILNRLANYYEYNPGIQILGIKRSRSVRELELTIIRKFTGLIAHGNEWFREDPSIIEFFDSIKIS
jgi:hypothetical protein